MRVIEMKQEDYRKIMHEDNGLIAAHAELQARFVELEAEVKEWKLKVCDWQDANSDLEEKLAVMTAAAEASGKLAMQAGDALEKIMKC